jgi:hypothetical protein
MIILRDAFATLSGTFVAVPIIQAFLISRGVTELQLGIVNTFIDIAVLIGVIFFMGRIDLIDSDKLVRTNRRYFSSAAILPFSLVFISLTGKNLSTPVIFIFVVVMWSVQNFFASPRTMIESKVAQSMFRSNIFGYAYGLDGIIYNSIGVVMGFLIKSLIGRSFGSVSGYSVAFILSLLIVPSAIFFTGKMRLLKKPATKKGLKVDILFKHFIRAFKNNNLKNVTILHVARGLLYGVMIFILPIGIRYYSMPLSYAGYIVMISSFGGILAYLYITIFYDRMGSFKTVVAASILNAAAITGLIITKQTIFYLIFIAMLYTGTSIVGISVPLGVYKITPSDFIGSYTGIRTLVMQISEAAMSMLLGIFVMKIPLISILCFSFVLIFFMAYFARSSFKNENEYINKS